VKLLGIRIGLGLGLGLGLGVGMLAGCDEDKPLTAEAQAVQTECKQVLRHVVEISPQGKGEDVAAVVAALPIEDLQACAATEPEIRGCIAHAADVDAVRKCPPSDDILGCMRKATKARDAAREAAGAKKPDPAIDQKFDDIRAKCWGGDAKAADGLKVGG
jgi:hypothetical protein